MPLSELFFVFIFLPAAIILYRLTPDRLRNALLLLLSLFFIAWGSLSDVILIALCIAFNYFTALELDHLRRSDSRILKKLVLFSGIAVNAGMLIFFKYFVFLINNVCAVIGTEFSFTVPKVPVGISFFTFSAISCLCDVAKGDENAVRNPLDFALYIAFFAKITSGPIVKFRDMARQLSDRAMTAELTESGMKLFIIGLSKKVIMAGCLGFLFDGIKAQDPASLSVAGAWTGALAYSLMLYYDFSGYSDMAIGLGKIFGFSFAKNFDHPYSSVSMTDFWRRWHISLGAWFRDYVYIPLGGSRVGRARNIFNLSVVWLLTGLWHGANWTFVVWGIYHLLLLLLEKFVLKGLLDRIPSLLRAAMTFLLAVIGWTVFFSDNIAYAGSYLLRMIGIGGSGLADRTGLFYLNGGVFLLVCAIIGATSLPSAALGKLDRLMERRIDKRAAAQLMQPVTALLLALLMLGCTAFMISDTVSSFLYAQF